MRTWQLGVLLLAGSQVLSGEGWEALVRGARLDGWRPVGDATWTIMRDGTLVGQRDPRKETHFQAWLYTEKEYEEFDLRFSFWIRLGGNSGIAIRDPSRARYVAGPEWDGSRSPARVAYEIQLLGMDDESWPTGSVYLFAKAKPGRYRPGDWNDMIIESRRDRILVRLNGAVVAETAGDASRPSRGPIGIQLHDVNTVVMFRDFQIREASDYLGFHE